MTTPLAQDAAESPLEHLRRCGPFCEHVVFCDECANVFALCRTHRHDPDAGVRWRYAATEPKP
jgi:hypothetical protein